MDLISNANNSSELSELSITSDRVHHFAGVVPILATPAAAMAGIAVGSAVVGAAGVGAALGEAVD